MREWMKVLLFIKFVIQVLMVGGFVMFVLVVVVLNEGVFGSLVFGYFSFDMFEK